MKKTKKPSISRLATVAVASIVLVSGLVIAPLSQPASIEAESLQELRARTAQLENAIKANNAQADQLRAQGDSLKTAIAALDLEIQQATAQIELTAAKINQLSEELKIAEKELERQKQLLKANMRALYKRGDVSTVELLVGSDSFSQFIDEQEYLERLKLGIQESTNKVLALTQQIEGQKNEQEKLKKQQEAQRELVRKAKNKQAKLLAETQGRESSYRARSAKLQEEQSKILAQIVARSRVLAGVGTGSYPWANYRDGAWTHQGSCFYGDDHDNWGYCYRQCTSFAAWRLYSQGKKSPMYYGNAENWLTRARSDGIPTGSQPAVGAIAVWDNFNEGHVAYVEEVMGGNDVRISEYNAVPAYQGRYSQRIINSGDPSGYIYFQ